MQITDRQKLASALADYTQSDNCPLRPLQKTVFHDIAKDLNAGHTKGHIRFPTGGGKGIMIGGQIEALLRAENGGNLALGDKKVLVLTPRTLLVNDLYERFTNGMFGDIPPDMVGKRHANMTDREKAEALQKPVLVTTYSTFNSLVRKGEIKADDYAVAMLDEVHRTRGEVVSQAIKDALPNSIVQGWTATDTYENANHVGQELFGREKAIHKTSFEDAVNAKPRILCPVVNYVVRTHIKADVSNRKGEDYRPSELKKVIQHHARDKMAIEMLANHRDEYTGVEFRGQNSVFYCVGVKHAEQMAEKLNEKFGEGYAEAVSGQTPKDELERIMQRYADPDDPLKSVTNADLLIEGWDAPCASLCFMLRPTKSPILAEQTGGRVMRLDPDNSNKIAYVMTFWDDNMPDMVTFGDVAGGYYLGMEEERIIAKTGGTREREGKPEWMEADPDLRGMEISFDYWKAAEFVDNVRQSPLEQDADEEAMQINPDLIPETGWLSLETLREDFALEYGVEQMQAIAPAGELLKDMERQAHAILDRQHKTFGEVPISVGGATILIGKFIEKNADSETHSHMLAVHEDDVETLKELIDERVERSGIAKEQTSKADTWNDASSDKETGRGNEWLSWMDLREKLGTIYSGNPRMVPPEVNAVLMEVIKKANATFGQQGQGEAEIEINGHALCLQKVPKDKASKGIFAIREQDIEALTALINERQARQRPLAWAERVRKTTSPPVPEEMENTKREWVTLQNLRSELLPLYPSLQPNKLSSDASDALTEIIRAANSRFRGTGEFEVEIGGYTLHMNRMETPNGTTLAFDRKDTGKIKEFIDTQLRPTPWSSRSMREPDRPSAGPGF